MEIKQLYRLGQLIRYLKSDEYRNIWNKEFKIPLADPKLLDLYFYDHCFSKADDWLDYLEQPFKEEMIFNKIEKPNINDFKSSPFCESGDCKAYRDELKAWQEAESKVVFDGYLADDGYYINNNMRYNLHDMLIGIKTLHDLAEYTKGELLTKNIKI